MQVDWWPLYTFGYFIPNLPSLADKVHVPLQGFFFFFNSLLTETFTLLDHLSSVSIDNHQDFW